MKWLSIYLLSIFVLAGSLQAQTSKSAPEQQNSIVDFSITMKDLALAAETQDDRAIPINRAIILDGDIGTITVYEDTDTSFVAEVELLNGIWVDEERVDLYRTYILFEGPQFRPLFASRSSQRLKSGQTIIVLATYEGLGVDYDKKTPVTVVRAIDMRKIY